ncbi:MAG: TetR/AcrR family transcriptional regulator C-terminal domain-containing protein, partial [Alphaproteobacteria bacterium]|nr:TetR/AcrR family transcriptional regulator C-terminal domain-containing protein [Alphaproteobacteria bacterium]
QAGSVYYHFESKEQMLGEILSIAVRSTYMAVKGSVESLPIEATPKDKIKAAIRAHLQSLHGNFDYTATNVKYQGQVPNVVERAVQPDRESYTEYWNQLIAAAAAAGELSPDLNLPFLRPLILGSLNRTINWYDPGRGDIETLVRTVLVLFDGLWSRAEAAGSEGGGST